MWYAFVRIDPSQLQSLTYSGLVKMVKRYAKFNREVKSPQHTSTTRKTFDSRNLQAVFVKGNIYPKSALYNSKCYSKSAPYIVITYTWSLDLIYDLFDFLDSVKDLLNINLEEMTLWLDIFFNDQTKTQESNDTYSFCWRPRIHGNIPVDTAVTTPSKLELALQEATEIYKNAFRHVVLLAHSTLSRGWCLFEIAVRLYMLKNKYRIDPFKVLMGIDQPEEFSAVEVVNGKKIERDEILKMFPLFITGKQTVLETDVDQYTIGIPQDDTFQEWVENADAIQKWIPYDAVGNMQTYDSESKNGITDRIQKMHGQEPVQPGDSRNFNMMVAALAFNAKKKVIYNFQPLL